MITLSLAWWMVPIAVLLAGFIAAWLAERNAPSGPYPMPIMGMLWSIGGIVAAIAIVIGHFL